MLKTLVYIVLLLQAATGMASVTNYYYVAPSGSATSPYGSWATAATTIQPAVDAASAALVPGVTECEVVVGDGTYALTSQITITNGITLRSLNGREATILDGQYPAYSNRCIEIRNSPGLVTVDGFTVRNGYAYLQAYGGGIFAATSAVAIVNCKVEKNTSSLAAGGLNGSGGGIAVIASTNYWISDCMVIGNTNATSSSGYGNGAGIYVAGTKGLITDCTIVSNSNSGLYGVGAGIHVTGGTAPNNIISNCMIAFNTAGESGGGLYYNGCTVTRCTIIRNTCRASGGGVYSYASGANRLTDSLIVSNRANNTGGGGVAINRGDVYNCVIAYNWAPVGGGYVSSEGSLRNSLVACNESSGNAGGVSWVNKPNSYQMQNCTIVNNKSGGRGGGIHTDNPNSNVFVNVIVRDNLALLSNNVGGIVWATNFVNSCSPDLTGGTYGNITADPLFTVSGTEAGTNAVLGDYRIATNSPCINAGQKMSWMTTTSRDLAGGRRIGPSWGLPDMGAYEAYSVSGPLTNDFYASPTVGTGPLEVTLDGEASGNPDGLLYRWDLGDGTVLDWSATNVLTHVYAARETPYTVVMEVTNAAGESASRTRTDYIMVYPAPLVRRSKAPPSLRAEL